ncbi:hypothetical protein LOY70_19495 [Pseudomonas sp. B21-054]|uniref:hypothetical protein n=1 Tax=Pseudomonas sp. B21-054 TaxID=2895494 RepID=UPI002232B571|nr:hypothetical protein [Pseudomonas sp. B21-054]UZE16075.1 hypothetical protein LOY70_19495 [Pseudomonas sp. B21-054]
MGNMFFESRGKGQALSAEAMLGQLHEAFVEAGKAENTPIGIQVVITGSKEITLNFSIKEVDELMSILELGKD